MRLQLDDEFPEYYLDIESCAYGLSFISVAEEETTVHSLTRKQVIELIAMLLVNTCPAPSYEELDESLVKLVFNNLPPGGGLLGKLEEI
jgi:hypothetical protein